ncbi:MAG: hypothetical protein ACTSR2_13490 [Candidatus Hodarchaeales archaeon]
MTLKQKKQYLLSVDIMKGIAIFPMVIGHSLQWWNRTLVNNYDQSDSLFIITIIVIGLMVLPLFLFVYGFNQTNSFLRWENSQKKKQITSHTCRRSLIFLLLASISQLIMWFVRSFPDLNLSTIPNYLVSWHLFHIFAFTSIFLWLIWKLSHLIQRKIFLNCSISTIVCFITSFLAISVFFLFVFFHEYTMTRPIVFPIEFQIDRIFEHIILDIGSVGLIPWLFFPLLGSITASILDIPNNKFNFLNLSKLIFFMTFGSSLLFVGLFSLNFERYASPALLSPSTYPHILISSGVLLLTFILLLVIIDLKEIFPRKSLLRYLLPIFLVSDISLTIFILHPLIFILDPKSIPNQAIFAFLAISYSLFFIPLAWFWNKFNYKLSMEWFIRKYS